MSDFERELKRAQAEAARSRKTAKWTMLGLALLSIILIGAVAVAVGLAASNADLATENASFGAQQQDEKKEIAKEASHALCGQGDRQIYDRELCAKWAEAAQEPTVPPVAPPLDNGPSQAELVNAFRIYCEEGNCRGADGAPPTADDIAAAFVRFCSDGRCVGQAGEKGTDGTNAEPLAPQYEMVLAAVTDVCRTGICNGPAGLDGANATQEMVLTAVQTVCANEACRGPAGPAGADSEVPGPEGKPGPAGRGYADTYCQDNGRWQITYTDGEIDYDAGKCREAVLPPATPGGLL